MFRFDDLITNIGVMITNIGVMIYVTIIYFVKLQNIVLYILYKDLCDRSSQSPEYKNFDPNTFLEMVRGLPWWRIYSCDDPDIAVELLSGFLTNILDILAPIKTFLVRKKYCHSPTQPQLKLG